MIARLRNDRRARVLLALIVVLALFMLFYLRGRAIASLHEELRKLQAQQEQILEDIEDLKALLARKDDLFYLEYLARRELGLIKPNEEKYILIEP